MQCAVDGVTFVQESWHDDWPDREITSLKDFAENDPDKRVCVAILQCNSIRVNLKSLWPPAMYQQTQKTVNHNH